MAVDAKYPAGTLEEELKNKVAADWFGAFDCSRILGKVDFCASVPATDLPLCDVESVLWAEAKRGAEAPLDFALVQLILTVGKERTFDRHLPPKYLAAFNAAKIAFIPYSEVVETFYQNDFNWNVAPSDHETREFGDLYQRWRETVMPTILMPDWAAAKKNGIIDADFFLADIFSSDNAAVTDRLNVLLMNDHYRQASGINALGFQLFSEISFSDGQKAHRLFWNRYRRPPRKEYWSYIVNRRDLLVPQDVRERKGSFFTPQKWVSLSQDYLAAVLGPDWQDDHYVWDCCCGTGNLEVGLTNKYNVWVSTLDQADVDVIHQRIKLGANLLDSHVFQFDFLNDSFDNVKGDFPIGFFVWRLGDGSEGVGRETLDARRETETLDAETAGLTSHVSPSRLASNVSRPAIFTSAVADVYDRKGEFIGTKAIHSPDGQRVLMDWIRRFYDKAGEHLAYCRYLGSDFQNNNGVFITLNPSLNDLKQVKGNWITARNLVEFAVYFAVRLCIEADWLNDREPIVPSAWNQSEEWAAAAFPSNAAEIAAVGGYAAWVAARGTEPDRRLVTLGVAFDDGSAWPAQLEFGGVPVVADGAAELAFAIDCGAKVPFTLTSGRLASVETARSSPTAFLSEMVRRKA